LDDTLIETSADFLPLKLRDVIRVLIKERVIADEEKSLNELLQISHHSPNAYLAIKEFLKIKDAENLLEAAVKEYYLPYKGKFKISLCPGVLETLKLLQKDHCLALVSFGQEKLQYQKISSSGIKKDLFVKIIITEKDNKKDIYQQLAQELGYSAEQVIVVGDKVKTDLVPAQELRMLTVQMQCGRGKQFPAKKGEVDYTISNLRELLNIVEKLSAA